MILPLSLHVFLQRRPRFVLKTHYALALIAVSFLEVHLFQVNSVYRWVLLGGICSWLACSVGTLVHAMWSHRSWYMGPDLVEVSLFNSLLWLKITVSAQMRTKPGQYVQLWMPRLGFAVCLELPIFFITSTEREQANIDGPSTSQKGKRKFLRVVTRPSSSLTNKLTQRILHAGLPSLNLPAFVFGPYGGAHSFGQNGTVVFALEDIGLLRALPFIRDLVEGSRERTNKVRRLEVLWQTEYSKFKHQSWVHREIQHILKLDLMGDRMRSGTGETPQEHHGFDILNFSIHLLHAPSTTRKLLKNRTRLHYYFAPVDVEKVMVHHIRTQSGKIAVTVCTGEKLRERVARITQREKCPRLSIVNLDMEVEPCVMRTTGGGEDPLGVEYMQDDDAAAPQRQGPGNSVRNTAVGSYKRNGGIFEDSTRGIPLVLLEDNNHARWVRSKILDGYKR
ncbi:hypothetical protein N7456_007030 [Penicillium angulare]|uniref:FAD-binding FR-type domain-containing protein n=1 Tax=Penicillium angulare TaxID=116970 RepID=A0A9W9KCJ1_9EURO|nr:hypothetical protein N7456_007030 [Penicillium angulare]